MELTTEFLLFGTVADLDETTLQYLKQCLSSSYSPNDSLTKFNEMMLILLDRFFLDIETHDKQIF